MPYIYPDRVSRKQVLTIFSNVLSLKKFTWQTIKISDVQINMKQ